MNTLESKNMREINRKTGNKITRQSTAVSFFKNVSARLSLRGLSVVALTAFFALSGTSIPAGTKAAALTGWLPSSPVTVLGEQRGTETATVDKAAMAQAMLDVLNQAMNSSEFGEAGLVDVDGDGIKELLVAYEPCAMMYSWQDGKLTVKNVGGLAGGYSVWYLCQDTVTGERGIQTENVGGGDYVGGESTYCYPSHNDFIGERIIYDDNGALLEEHYYIDDLEAAKADYQAAKKRNRTLEEVSTESWYGQDVQFSLIRAELEAIRNGGTLQNISNEGLLALAKTAVYALPSMHFELATGGLIPQDMDDYIAVNMGHDGFGEVYAYRVLDCKTAAEVEATVQNIWHKSVSRRYPVNYKANVIEYAGQVGNYTIGDLLHYNGALYVVENYGIGDEGFEYTVDRIISRTENEAIFHVCYDHGELSISLIYEDGAWKYGEMW